MVLSDGVMTLPERVSEEDERALTEVIEYTRMAVLAIHAETQAHNKQEGTAH